MCAVACVGPALATLLVRIMLLLDHDPLSAESCNHRTCGSSRWCCPVWLLCCGVFVSHRLQLGWQQSCQYWWCSRQQQQQAAGLQQRRAGLAGPLVQAAAGCYAVQLCRLAGPDQCRQLLWGCAGEAAVLVCRFLTMSDNATRLTCKAQMRQKYSENCRHVQLICSTQASCSSIAASCMFVDVSRRCLWSSAVSWT
jgi:hypothetical protein